MLATPAQPLEASGDGLMVGLEARSRIVVAGHDGVS